MEFISEALFLYIVSWGCGHSPLWEIGNDPVLKSRPDRLKLKFEPKRTICRANWRRQEGYYDRGDYENFRR